MPVSPHDSAAIAELTAEVRGLRGDLLVLHTKMFGDADAENVQGRIPRIEAEHKDFGDRVSRLEKRQDHRDWRARSLSAVGGFILSLAALLYYMHNLVRR